jgi:hypothetical protein
MLPQQCWLMRHPAQTYSAMAMQVMFFFSRVALPDVWTLISLGEWHGCKDTEARQVM